MQNPTNASELIHARLLYATLDFGIIGLVHGNLPPHIRMGQVQILPRRANFFSEIHVLPLQAKIGYPYYNNFN